MSFIFSTNNSCTNCTDVVFKFKQFMTTSSGSGGPGWSVVASSGGTGGSTFSSSSDVISSSASGSGGFSNANAWFVLRAPGGTSGNYKEFSFQRLSTDNLYRVKYTANGFDLSSGSQTQVPSATSSSSDYERVILGGGTDSSPTGSNLFNSSYTNQTLISHFCAQEQSDGYGFYALANKNAVTAGFFAFDPLMSASYPSQDLDPYVTMFDNTSSVLSKESIHTPNSYTTCYLQKGSPGTSVRIQGFYPVLYGSEIIGSLPSNPYNSKDDTFPVLYARRGSEPQPNGYKGQSLLLKWHGQNRSDFSIFSIDVAGDRLIVGNVSLPWNNTTVTI